MNKNFGYLGYGLFFLFGPPVVIDAIEQLFLGKFQEFIVSFEGKVVCGLIAIMGALMLISWQLGAIANKPDGKNGPINTNRPL